MSVAEALQIMIAFGSLIISLVAVIISIIVLVYKNDKK